MDINGGQLTQTNGNPVWPTATSTGPLVAGNVMHGDGVSALAGLGEQIGGTGNAGYAVMGQFSAPFSQVTASGAGGAVTQIVIPAQSMIVQMLVFVTTAWTGASTTITITDTASNTYGTAAGASLGIIGVSPTASKAVVQVWENVGNTDVQISVTAGNTGSGQCILWVRYLQGCNSAQST